MSRVVLITGCSRGIGHAAALRLAERGWTVVATLRGDEGRAALEAAGVEIARVDVTKTAQILDAVDGVVGRHGRLDALVANAGQGIFGCFEDVDQDQVRALFELNVMGVLECARAALPHLRASRGRLVVLSSVAGRRSAPGSSIYNASKFALEGWGEALALELDPFGVRVVLVEPGPTATGFTEHVARGRWAGTGPYAKLTERLIATRKAAFRGAEPPETVVAAILHGLEARDPPLRLPTGSGTRASILAAQLLPWGLYRWLVRRKIGG